jgi:hypothetical protein
MSVVVSDRNESKLQVIITATDIKTNIHELCLRDFGIRDMNSIIRKKYDTIANLPNKYERYALELYRDRDTLHKLSDILLFNVRAANRQRMNTIRKCNIRLEYQDKALDICELLIAKLQDIVNFFAVDISTFKPVIGLIDNEIKLLKQWIKHTKKIKSNL